jgi:hypothetical protein
MKFVNCSLWGPAMMTGRGTLWSQPNWTLALLNACFISCVSRTEIGGHVACTGKQKSVPTNLNGKDKFKPRHRWLDIFKYNLEEMRHVNRFSWLRIEFSGGLL